MNRRMLWARVRGCRAMGLLRQGVPPRGSLAKSSLAVLFLSLAAVVWLGSSTGASSAPTASSSASRPHLTIHGSWRGSTLELSVRNGRLKLRGRRISFTLSEPARITLSFARRTGRHYKRVHGSLARTEAKAGKHTLRFSGKLGHHKLKPED